MSAQTAEAIAFGISGVADGETLREVGRKLQGTL